MVRALDNADARPYILTLSSAL